jgi:hypothetical protein
MAAIRTQTWKTLMIIALVVLLIYLVFSGLLIWYVGLLLLLLAMAGGALMYRNLGPPDH